jgi:hypothetical protein
LYAAKQKRVLDILSGCVFPLRCAWFVLERLRYRV